MLMEHQGQPAPPGPTFHAPATVLNRQSNAKGQDIVTTGWVADPRVSYYEFPGPFGPLAPRAGNLHGCELTLANAIAVAQNGNVFFGKDAVDGSHLTQWLPLSSGGTTPNFWPDLQTTIGEMRGKGTRALFINFGGESEGAASPGSITAAQYFAQEQVLRANVEAEFGIPVFWWEVFLNAAWLLPGGVCASNGANILAGQQLMAAVPNTRGVSLDAVVPPGTPAGLHYVNGEQLTIGNIMAPFVVTDFTY